MSDFKDVKVSLQPQDEKALSRTKTRRRRRNAGTLESAMDGGEPSPVIAIKADSAQTAAPLVTLPTVVAQPAIVMEPPKHEPTVPVAPLATTTAVGGGVKLQAKKVAPLAPALQIPTVASPAPRIVPHKKRVSSAAAAHTLKKPKFVIHAHPPLSRPDMEHGKVESPSRKFAERKISITMRPSSTTRRMRRTLKSKISAMPLSAVKRMLLRKGVLKPKATAPPEEMMRSMLRDYMLLHAAE